MDRRLELSTQLTSALGAAQRFGQPVAVPPSALKEIQFHRRVQDLRIFKPLQVSSEIGVESLGNIDGASLDAVRERYRQEADAASQKDVLRRVDVAGEKLTSLREHIAEDQEANAKKA
jgi:hypothetical protein